MNGDYDEALKEFNDEFMFAWKQYSNVPDSKLTKDARALKKRLLEYVKRGS